MCTAQGSLPCSPALSHSGMQPIKCLGAPATAQNCPRPARQAVGPASEDAHGQPQGTLSSDASPAAEGCTSQAALNCCPGQPACTPLKRS